MLSSFLKEGGKLLEKTYVDMIILLFLLCSLFFLSPLAQAKDKSEVIQKADILFKAEAKKSPKVEQRIAPKAAPAQTVTTAQTKEADHKVKDSTLTPPRGVAPAPASSVKEPAPNKTETDKTKAITPPPSPLASKPAETPSSDTKGMTEVSASGSPLEPKKEAPPASTSAPVVPVSATGGSAVGQQIVPTSLQEILQQAYECLQKDKKYEARNLYSQALFMETSEERRQLIRKHLEELNNVLLFSSTLSPDFVVYKVQAGDNLTKIAKQYNTTAELIMRLNRKDSPLLRIGEQLKILKGKVGLLVDKTDFTLTLLLDGHYLKQYPIGLGKNDKTPEGRFIVENKMKEPTWFSPDGKVYPYGSVQNILGTRWIGFKNQPGLSGYGIHGTTEPESIGTESSNGCVRMLNQDVEELYDYVMPGTEVVIQR